MERYHQLSARLDRLRLDMEGQAPVLVTPRPRWQPVPTRDGIRTYHVPDPDGRPDLYVAVYVIDAGAHTSGASSPEARLFAVLEGRLTVNGRPVGPGESVYLAPGEPCDWLAHEFTVSVARFNVPPPDLTDTL